MPLQLSCPIDTFLFAECWHAKSSLCRNSALFVYIGKTRIPKCNGMGKSLTRDIYDQNYSKRIHKTKREEKQGLGRTSEFSMDVICSLTKIIAP